MAPTAEEGPARRVNTFDIETLTALAAARTVAIETARLTGPTRRTVIWVVVADPGRVFVRSVRGARGRWHRDLVANRAGTLVVGDTRIAFRAEVAGGPDRIAACSRALEAKYAHAGGSLASMLRPETLETTLELVPA
jgi:hypothetical protein